MISQRMVSHGNYLFRFRSYLPLLFIVPLTFSMWNFRYLYNSHLAEQFWLWFCFAVSASGLFVRVTTVGYVPHGTSGRNTQGQVAEVLNQSGWYSICRNPLYLGNFLLGLGFVMAAHDVAVTLVYVAAFWLYYERIIAAEEDFLANKFGAQYTDWAQRTPLFLPAFQQWRRPEMAFCIRTVLRREYSAVLLVGSVFTVLNVSECWVAERQLRVDTPWLVLFSGCSAVFVVLRTLKKKTSLLRVSGR